MPLFSHYRYLKVYSKTVRNNFDDSIVLPDVSFYFDFFLYGVVKVNRCFGICSSADVAFAIYLF